MHGTRNWMIKRFDELSAFEIYEILKSRAEIFVKEQSISYVDEDNVDYESLHIFCLENNRVTAYLRAFNAGEGIVKVGRVLTLEHGKGHGTELMELAIKEIPQRMNCSKICMDAQKHAVPFYERLGFVVTSKEYLEEGIVHVDMCMEI